jgi:hypothetical protein
MRNGRHAFREAADACLPHDVDVLLLVPPFSFLHNPALGVHLLQACARQRGFAVGVLYANLVFAKASGVEIYNRIANSSPMWMAGERIFAHAAFGATAARVAEAAAAGLNKFREAGDEELDAACLARLVEDARELCLAVGAAVADRGYRVVGASSTFQQTASSVGLLNEVKRRSGGRVVTVLGGSNCEGPMGEGLAGLGNAPDYIFSGECETTFPDFLDDVIRRGRLPQPRFQRGAPGRLAGTAGNQRLRDASGIRKRESSGSACGRGTAGFGRGAVRSSDSPAIITA